jgi:hypothetical protein
MADHAAIYKMLVEHLAPTAKALANAGHQEEQFDQYLPLIGVQPDPDADVTDGDPADENFENAAPLPGSWVRIVGVRYTLRRMGGSAAKEYSGARVELEVVTPMGRTSGGGTAQGQLERTAYRHPKAVDAVLASMLELGRSRQPGDKLEDFGILSVNEAEVVDEHDHKAGMEVTVMSFTVTLA